MEFVDYEDEIPQNWYQINRTDVSKRVRTISSLIHSFHGYNFVLLLLEWYAEECARSLLTHSKFGFEDLKIFLLRRCCQSWNENYYPFD